MSEVSQFPEHLLYKLPLGLDLSFLKKESTRKSINAENFCLFLRQIRLGMVTIPLLPGPTELFSSVGVSSS